MEIGNLGLRNGLIGAGKNIQYERVNYTYFADIQKKKERSKSEQEKRRRGRKRNPREKISETCREQKWRGQRVGKSDKKDREKKSACQREAYSDGEKKRARKEKQT